MKKATILFIGLLTAVSVFAGSFETPEDLAEQFIANINAKDQKGQWELLHPRCVKELSSLQKEFIDASIARDFRKTIPEKRNIKVTKLEEGALSFARSLALPVKPTHRFDVEFSTGEGVWSRTAISRFIAKENDRWFITVPIMDEESLRKRRDKFSELYVAGYNMSPGPYLGSLENRTDYGKMLARELGIKHANVRMRYVHPVYIAAHFSKEIEGKKVHAYSVALKKPTAAVGISFLYRTVPLDPQDDTGTHRFRVVLSGYEKGKDGLEKETEREYLSQNQKSQQISGTSVAINSFLFNRKEPLPINKRVSYYKLLDSNGIDGKDVLYSIDFEVSDKPIKTYEFFKK